MDQNTSTLEDELKSLVLQRTGLEAQVEKVQTSDVRSIDRVVADAIVADRLVIVDSTATAFAQVAQLQQVIETLKTRVAALEDYIEST